MTPTPIHIRAISAAAALVVGAGILAAAQLATRTAEAGLAILQLERVVVLPAPGRLAEARAQHIGVQHTN